MARDWQQPIWAGQAGVVRGSIPSLRALRKIFHGQLSPPASLPLVGDLYSNLPSILSCWGFSDPDVQRPGAFGFPVLFCSKLESVESLQCSWSWLGLVINNQPTFGFAASGDMIEDNFLSG